jgi:undecaprenyl-diphosphatase
MKPFEFAVLNWIQLHCRCPFLDAVMPVFSLICNHGEVWIALTILLLLFRRTRRIGATLTAALLLDLLCCNVFLKPLIARIRPCDVNTAVQLLIPRPTDYSFPSGHAAVSFTATAALKASGSRLWSPAFVLSLLICFSRLYLYVHWPSDVLAGAALGAALGYLGRRLLLMLEARRGKRQGKPG